jgi:hypothetical protein
MSVPNKPVEIIDVEDFPAAHSMDTTWFGIDADGFVAEFQTGENGILPEIAQQERDDWDLHRILWSADIECDIEDVLEKKHTLTHSNLREIQRLSRLDDLGKPKWQSYGPDRKLSSNTFYVTTGEEGSKLEVSVTVTAQGERSSELYDCLLICTDFPELLASFPTPARAGDGLLRLNYPGSKEKVLALVPYVKLEELISLFDRGLVSSGWDWCSLDVQRFGVFKYKCTDHFSIADKYELTSPPRRPVRIDEIPFPARELLQGVRFPDVSFARGDLVWPRRYYLCRGWGGEI